MKKAILAALLATTTTHAGAVAMCVNNSTPDGAEIGLCRTDSLALCPQGATSNQFAGNGSSAAACDSILEPYLSQRQIDARAAQARTDAWLIEAQAMCQALAGQCVADRVAYMQNQWDLAQAAAAQAIADAAAAAAAAQALAAANTIMVTNQSPIQIAAPATTTPAAAPAAIVGRPAQQASSGGGSSSHPSAGSGYGGADLSWGGRTKFVSAGIYRTAAEWDEIAKAKKADDESVKIAQSEPAPAKRHCDEFFETRLNVEYWGSRDQKGNINNVCRKPARK